MQCSKAWGFQGTEKGLGCRVVTRYLESRGDIVSSYFIDVYKYHNNSS